MPTLKKKWFGRNPVECQICNLPPKNFFIDGRTKGGQWAIMCLPCHSLYGRGLGTGFGQKYNTETLEKVEG